MRWVVVVLGLLAAGCLGDLRLDPVAASIALAPRAALGLPVRNSRSYWLLRAVDGWYSAHEVRFGGDPADPAGAAVRVVRFRSEDAARAGFARLTPAYLYAAFRDRMTGEPYPFTYPAPLPGDEVSVTLFGVRPPPDAPEGTVFLSQMTTIRAGAVVLLVESAGVPLEHLVPAIRELVAAARREGGRQ